MPDTLISLMRVWIYNEKHYNAEYKVTSYCTQSRKLTSKHLVQTSIKFYYVLYNVTTGYLLHEKFPKGLIFCF